MGGSLAGMACKMARQAPPCERLGPSLRCGAPMAETKFAQFLATKKIDRRRLLAASRKLETLHPEDRAIRLKKRQLRVAAAGGAEGGAKETRKPRSGRPVTHRA